MIPVKNQPHLYRDGRGAIINTNTNDFDVYTRKRDLARKQQVEIDSLKSSINNLNNDVAEIKQALKTIIEIIK